MNEIFKILFRNLRVFRRLIISYLLVVFWFVFLFAFVHRTRIFALTAIAFHCRCFPIFFVSLHFAFAVFAATHFAHTIFAAIAVH